jgi:NADPH-dependent ferric siderophore reductase
VATQTQAQTATAEQTVRAFDLFPAEVRALRRLSPAFVRVTFAGETLAHFADNGFDQRFKLIFPAPACGFDKMPRTERWYSELRALPEQEQCGVRTYTVRAVRPELGEVDVDMVIHEAGANEHCGPARSATSSCCWARTRASTARTAASTSMRPKALSC